MQNYQVTLIGHSYIKRLENHFPSEIVHKDLFRIRLTYLGIGGALVTTFSDHLERLDSCLRFKPHIVLLFLGGNDLTEGCSISQILAKYNIICRHIKQLCPDTFLVASYVEPRYAKPGGKFKLVNPETYLKLARAINHSLGRNKLVDKKFLTHGKTRFSDPDLFDEKGIHLNSRGEERLFRLLSDLFIQIVKDQFLSTSDNGGSAKN